MFKRFLPETTDFFSFFEQHCAIIIEAAKELRALAEPGAQIELRVARIRELEHEADTLTHRCITALKRTFITPFERGDIHELIRHLDDVIDSINDAGSRILLYNIQEIRNETQGLADAILHQAEALGEALRHLRNLKHEKAISAVCIKIHRYENDADELLRAALRRLFSENVHPYQVIQWKEIFEHLERATDRCEDVADIIQGVLIEAS